MFNLLRVFCNGLLKAATTTGAWIMSFGLNTGLITFNFVYITDIITVFFTLNHTLITECQ